jgi:hypothetical protein
MASKKPLGIVIDIRRLALPWWQIIGAVAVAALGVLFNLWLFSASINIFLYILIMMMLIGSCLVLAWPFKPVGFDCPHCNKRLSTASEWVCGYCDNKNTPVPTWGLQSIVSGCGRWTCRKRPKAYVCDFCDEMIFFDKDRNDQYPATAVGKPRPKLVVYRPSEEVEEIEVDPEIQERRKALEAKKQKQQWESELVGQEIELVQLQRKLAEQRKLLDRLKSPEFWEDEDEKTPPSDPVEFVRRKEKHTRRWSAEEQRINNDETIDDSLKKLLIDSGRRFLHTKLNAMKPK